MQRNGDDHGRRIITQYFLNDSAPEGVIILHKYLFEGIWKMNTIRLILSMFFITTLLASCFNLSPKDGPNGIGLDNGNKWQLDDETITAASKMNTFFLSTDPLSNQRGGLKKTGSALRTQMTALFTDCGVSGAAHDEYHVYLAGLIPAITTLEKSGQLGDAKRVKYYLEKFSEYFESNKRTDI